MTAYQNSYAQLFAHKIFFLKVGGKLLENTAFLEQLINDVSILAKSNIKIIFIFGGGPQISSLLKNENKIDGVRVTDKKDMDRIVPLIDQMGKNISDGFQKKGILSHYEKNLYSAGSKGKKWGQTGIPTKFHSDIWQRSKKFSVNVIGCTAFSEDTLQSYNVNADEITSFLAHHILPEKVIFFSETAVLDADENTISVLTPNSCREYMKQKVISGGMIAKTKNIFSLLRSGIHRVHLLSAQDSLHEEIFSVEGQGTLCVPDWDENVHWRKGEEYTREFLYQFLLDHNEHPQNTKDIDSVDTSLFSVLEFDSFPVVVGESKKVTDEVVELSAFMVEGRMKQHGIGSFFLRRYCEDRRNEGFRIVYMKVSNPHIESLLAEEGFSSEFEAKDIPDISMKTVDRKSPQKVYAKKLFL
jgi:acetylglutamate kinase